MNLQKNQDGITFVSFIIIVTILIMLSAILIINIIKIMNNSKVESVMTNMITIKAKAKMYSEEVNAQVWDLTGTEKIETRRNIFANSYNLNISESDDIDHDYYEVTEDVIYKMELNEIDLSKSNYTIIFDTSTYTEIDIKYNKGIVYKGNTYYTLSELQDVMNI